MRLKEGGGLYGFCPSKATWDGDAVRIYRLLVIAADTGVMLEAGGLNDQPSWWVEMLGWFVPLYIETRFSYRFSSFSDDISRLKSNASQQGLGVRRGHNAK